MMQLCVALFAIWIVVVSCVHLPHSNTEKALLEWIDALPGGWVHPAQEIRKLKRAEIGGNTGVFAKSSIDPGQTLVEIPASHVIRNPKSQGLLDCKLAAILAKEMALGDRSMFAPFVQHALHHARNHNIPSNWSDKGKALLREIIGGTSSEPEIPPFEPVEWLSDDWKGVCGGNLDDEIAMKAALLVVQWNHNGNILPFAGLYKHRNGNWTNAEIVTSDTDKVVLRTTREISTDEEILISLNECRECGRREPGYGTAEILRDSGVLESYPQRWHYFDRQIQFEIDLVDDLDSMFTFNVKWLNQEGMYLQNEISHLVGRFHKVVRRLLRIINVDYRDGNPGIPPSEWEISMQFCQANLQAMTLAISSIQSNYSNRVSVPNHLLISNGKQSHYDPFLWEPDDIDYFAETCDSFEDEIDFIQHRDVEQIISPFQNVQFYIHPDTRDVVLDLDHVVQIASVYRPQYHETMVHSAARFLDSVKRVLFVGGGDSMLLHEILKYPELELVVGLELDQLVVRKSFKYFHAQPHFDNPLVEWWFGDATKSLLLLWEEYWRSFDLVLVDLSETAMSFSVTKQLNMFDALSLLLKPDGIMVKNEQYLNEFSDVFDHVMGIFIMCPVLCDQSFVMGSNGIDFLHAPMKDHGIETLLFDTRADNISRMMDVHDYRHNNAIQRDKCETASDRDIGDERVGLMEILDIELQENLSIHTFSHNSAAIASAIQGAGFVSLGSIIFAGDQLFVPMEEGYVLVRSMGNTKHCSIDIQMWGSFHKLKRLSTAVVAALGSAREVSRYRVVVGGMYDASTWETDRTMIGPKIPEPFDCNQPPSSPDEGPKYVLPENILESTIYETLSSMSFAHEGDIVLFCGNVNGDCSNARRTLRSEPQHVVEVSTCANLGPSPNLSDMFECEDEVQQHLIEYLQGGKGAVWVVDHSVPFEMLQIIHSILSRDDVRRNMVHPQSVFLLWSLHPSTEPWRRLFLDRYRRLHELDPVSLAEYDVSTSSSQGGELAMQIGILSLGNPTAAHEFVTVENSLQEQLSGGDVGLKVVLQNITGGKFAPWDPYNPKEFSPSDYDETPALDQYFSQRPLGYQILVHLETNDGNNVELNGGQLETRVKTAMARVDFGCSVLRRYENVGQGLLLICLHATSGSVILTWDGKTRIDVSYTRFGTKMPIDWQQHGFIGTIESVLDNHFQVIAHQEMPRGSGRVVNLAKDIKSRKDYDLFWERLHLAPERGRPDFDASFETTAFLQEL